MPGGVQLPHEAGQQLAGKEDGSNAPGSSKPEGSKKVTLRLKRPLGAMMQQPPSELPQQGQQQQQEEQASPASKRLKTQEEGDGAQPGAGQ
jgi:hypothetical protein